MVLPRASTAGSLRIMALRRAMRATPMASVTVSAAGSPSGIIATASAIAAVKVSTADWPRSTPTTKATTARARITYSTTWLNWAMRRVSGVVRSWAEAMSWEMRPTSVLSPVATTMPVLCP